MIVKITRCSGEMYWYKNDIGKTFDVLDIHQGSDYGLYRVVNLDNDKTVYVEKSDCVKIDELRDNKLNEIGI